MFSFLYQCQDFYRTWMYIRVTRLVSYRTQELLALCEHPSSLFCSLLKFVVLYQYVSLRFKFCIVMSVTISAWKRCSIRLNLELFVEGLMSYLRYLCLFPYSGVQHILCCVFALSFFVLCTIWCQFLWIVNCWLPLRYYLTFIYCRSLHICKKLSY
jgi:hypothetical protein